LPAAGVMLDGVLDLAPHTTHGHELRTMMNRHAFGFEVGGTHAGDVGVLERKDPLCTIDDVDLGLSEIGKDRGELTTDDACSQNHETSGKSAQVCNVIGG